MPLLQAKTTRCQSLVHGAKAYAYAMHMARDKQQKKGDEEEEKEEEQTLDCACDPWQRADSGTPRKQLRSRRVYGLVVARCSRQKRRSPSEDEQVVQARRRRTVAE